MAKQRRKHLNLPLQVRESFEFWKEKSVSLGSESFGKEWVKATVKVIAKEYTHIRVWIFTMIWFLLGGQWFCFPCKICSKTFKLPVLYLKMRGRIEVYLPLATGLNTLQKEIIFSTWEYNDKPVYSTWIPAVALICSHKKNWCWAIRTRLYI